MLRGRRARSTPTMPERGSVQQHAASTRLPARTVVPSFPGLHHAALFPNFSLPCNRQGFFPYLGHVQDRILRQRAAAQLLDLLLNRLCQLANHSVALQRAAGEGQGTLEGSGEGSTVRWAGGVAARPPPAERFLLSPFRGTLRNAGSTPERLFQMSRGTQCLADRPARAAAPAVARAAARLPGPPPHGLTAADGRAGRSMHSSGVSEG